jgi:hypothetical protein
MITLDAKNRIIVFKAEGHESILGMVKQLGEGPDPKYAWYDSERRGPMFLIKRKDKHSGTAFILHQQLESVFKSTYRKFLKMYNSSGFSPRPNFIMTKIGPRENFMSHQDFNIDDPEDEITGYVAVYYLNDEFEGGELYFDDLDITYKPIAGTVIVFPVHLWHRIKTVDGTHRYTAMLVVEKYSDLSLASTKDLWPEG